MWDGVRTDKYDGIDMSRLSSKYRYYGYHDQIGFGSSEIMDIYSNAVNQIDFLLDNTDVLYHPEMLIQKHLECNNISVNTLLPLRWVLLR